MTQGLKVSKSHGVKVGRSEGFKDLMSQSPRTDTIETISKTISASNSSNLINVTGFCGYIPGILWLLLSNMDL